MAGNTYADPSASRDKTIGAKVSVPNSKSLGAGHNKGQKHGGSGQTGSTTAGMHKASIGTGYSKGQNTGGTNGSGHRCKTFSSGGVINGKV